MVAPPCELAELVIARPAENHGVAVGKFARQPRKLGNLGRANEGEVLRVEKDDLPLAGKLASFSVSNALCPFSSWTLNPGFTPITSNGGSLSPIPNIHSPHFCRHVLITAKPVPCTVAFAIGIAAMTKLKRDRFFCKSSKARESVLPA